MKPHYRPKATPAEINKALLIIKNAIATNSLPFRGERTKNMNTLAQLGFTTQNVLDIIMELTYKNYLNGPTDDRDIKEDAKTIWEFGYEVENAPIYIKIKVKQIDKAIGISFHIAEKPLFYHFKD